MKKVILLMIILAVISCNKENTHPELKRSSIKLQNAKIIDTYHSAENDKLLIRKIKAIFQESEAKTNSGYSKKEFVIKERHLVSFDSKDKLLEVTVEFTDTQMRQKIYIEVKNNIFRSDISIPSADKGTEGGDLGRGYYCWAPTSGGGCCCKMGYMNGNYVCPCTCQAKKGATGCTLHEEEGQIRM